MKHNFILCFYHDEYKGSQYLISATTAMQAVSIAIDKKLFGTAIKKITIQQARKKNGYSYLGVIQDMEVL